MTFRIDREELTLVFKILKSFIPNRPNPAALAAVHCRVRYRTLQLTGTDGNTSVQFDLKVTDAAKGECCLPLRDCYDWLKDRTADTVVVHANDGVARMSAGKQSHSFELVPLDRYPVPAFPADLPVRGYVDTGELDHWLQRVVPYSMEDPFMRPVLSGIYVHQAAAEHAAVATNGNRLVIRSAALPLEVPPEGWLLRRAALTGFTKVFGPGTIEVAADSDSVAFASNDTRLVTTLIKDPYPDFRRVIPHHTTTSLVVPRKETLQLLRAMEPGPHNNRVVLSLNAAGPKIEGGKGTVELSSAFYAGKPLRIAFNKDYLLGALRTFDSDDVEFTFTEPERATKVRAPGDDSTLVLVMPLRIID
jgi:DNA polymerase III subunit beta